MRAIHFHPGRLRFFVMAGLDPAIALNIVLMQMAGSSPAMTGARRCHD